MLDQVIYTRCFPTRDLIRNGEVLGNDGYGVFTMSETLFAGTGQKDREALARRFTDYNGSKENGEPGILYSYEYVNLPGGKNAMIFCAMRKKEETERVTRPFGGVIRPNSFVEQALVGAFADYPTRWFASSEWNAHLVSVADYYMDHVREPRPEFLGQVPDKPSGGYVTQQTIRDFIRAGREDTVKAAVWFLVREYDKPEEERKVLLIRDDPGKVELWIAAIESGLSQELAGTIPFSTNVSKLNTSPETRLFCSPDGAADSGMPGRAAQQNVKKVPLFMIAGFHPKDPYCSSVRQTASSRYVILDGILNQIGVEPDETIQSKYYQAVIAGTQDIRDFCEVVLPGLPLKQVSGKIPELYDAYKYLLDSNHKSESWRYEEALWHLERLSQFGICENPVLIRYLLDEFLAVYGRKFLMADGQSGYSLLKLLGKYAVKIGREAEISTVLSDNLMERMKDLRTNGHHVSEIWTMLARTESDMTQMVLETVFAQGRLSEYRKQFANCTAECVRTVADMYFTMRKNSKLCLGEPGEELAFAAEAVRASVRDKIALEAILNGMRNDYHFMEKAVFHALWTVRGEQEEVLWNILFQSNPNGMEAVCEAAVANRVEPERVETALASRIRREGCCSDTVEKAFFRLLDVSEEYADMGLRFYAAWCSVCDREEYLVLAESVQDARLPEKIEKKVFGMTDQSIPADMLLKGGGQLAAKLDEWAGAFRLRSKTGILFEIYTELGRAKSDTEALEILERYIPYALEQKEDFFRGRYFEEITRLAGRFLSAAVNLAMLCIFVPEHDRAMDLYVRNYADIVLSNAKKQTAAAMVGLCEVICLKLDVRGVNDAYASQIRGKLRYVFERLLSGYYKSSLFEEVNRIREVDESVRDYLNDLLQREEEQKGSNKLKDFLRGIGGLFSKK